jgi:hypothetical protein
MTAGGVEIRVDAAEAGEVKVDAIDAVDADRGRAEAGPGEGDVEDFLTPFPSRAFFNRPLNPPDFASFSLASGEGALVACDKGDGLGTLTF